MGLRFRFGSFILMIPARRQIARRSTDQWIAAGLVGVLMGLAMSIWVLGLFSTTRFGEGDFITSFSVVLVPVVYWAVFRVRPSIFTFIALPTGLVGMALLWLRP